MSVICIEETAFYAMIEKVIEGLQGKTQVKHDKWISVEQAMALLHIKSKTTLQKLRDEGKIISTPAGKFMLYDKESIIDYLDDFTYETF